MSLYIDIDLLKSSLNIEASSTSYDDHLELAAFAASDAIDLCADTKFQLSDDSNDEARVFTPQGPGMCQIDDLASFTKLEIDRDADGDHELELQLGVHFVLEPANAAGKGWPYRWVKIRQASPRTFPDFEQSVKVTGRYGWLETPQPIVDCTMLLAEQLFKRISESPFGIVSLNAETAARVLRYDPHMTMLLEPYSRVPLA